MPAPVPAQLIRTDHHHPGLAALVGLGGAVGSVGRYGLTHVAPAGTVIVNLLGAFLLGVLLEVLARPGVETPSRRTIRLTVGTGVLGGFTTYSAFALEVLDLLADGRIAIALAYALGAVIAGLIAGVVGVLAVARWRS